MISSNSFCIMSSLLNFFVSSLSCSLFLSLLLFFGGGGGYIRPCKTYIKVSFSKKSFETTMQKLCPVHFKFPFKLSYFHLYRRHKGQPLRFSSLWSVKVHHKLNIHEILPPCEIMCEQSDFQLNWIFHCKLNNHMAFIHKEYTYVK